VARFAQNHDDWLALCVTLTGFGSVYMSSLMYKFVCLASRYEQGIRVELVSEVPWSRMLSEYWGISRAVYGLR
jgi:hypothetical protein